MVSEDEARQAKYKLLDLLKSVDPNASVGLTKDVRGWGVKVNLGCALPPQFETFDFLDGVPVSFEIVGKITPR
jgi:hypothetical protein